MASLILIPIFFGIILYKLPVKLGKIILMVVQVALVGLAVFLFLQTESTPLLTTILGGNDPILNIALRADRFAFALVLLSNFMFAILFVFKIKDEFFNGKLMLLFLILQGLTSGIFLTDDLFNLFILFEVSTVITTILIMYKGDGRSKYDALYYLITQMVSMMFFLFGIAYTYRLFGVLSISTITNLIPFATRTELILPFAFMMTGLCFKTGMFPMFGWVSRAYGLNSAPMTQLAIMSGVLIKTSLYWMLQFHDIFRPVLNYTPFFLALGVVTALGGALKALSQKDIRLILAYSTISQIGLMVTSASGFADSSQSYAHYHIIIHAIIKVILFLCAEIVIENYKTTNIYEIEGVFKKLPFVSICLIVGVLSMTAFPLSSGSISKYFMSSGLNHPMLDVAYWMMSFATILVFVKFSQMFFGQPASMTHVLYKTNIYKRAVLSILVIACLLSGLHLERFVNYLFLTDYAINWANFLVKNGIYFVLVVMAGLVLKNVLVRTKFLYENYKHTLSFSRMCLMIVLFFGVLVAYGMWGGLV